MKLGCLLLVNAGPKIYGATVKVQSFLGLLLFHVLQSTRDKLIEGGLPQPTAVLMTQAHRSTIAEQLMTSMQPHFEMTETLQQDSLRQLDGAFADSLSATFSQLFLQTSRGVFEGLS